MISAFNEIDFLSPSDFEIFIKNLIESIGWKNARITEVGKDYKHGDGGIDIFAYRNEIKYGFEVKHRSKQDTVDISALNQLVTGGRLSGTKNLVLITNSYFTSEVKSRALKLGVELIDRELLHSIYIEKQVEIGRTTVKPRKYQETIIENSINAIASGKKRVFIEMATGLGKTYTSAMIIKEYFKQTRRKYRVLFLVHQIELVIQSITSFKNVMGVGMHSYSACFDGDTPADTDFVFATFDSVYVNLNKIQINAFDFIIVDEAHHAPANTYNFILSYLKPQVLIGMSATPFREDGKDVIEIFGGNDGLICKYDLVWALKHNKLAFPRYMVMLSDLNLDKINKIGGSFKLNDIDRYIFLNQKDEEIMSEIQKAIAEYQIESPKAIVFCRSINHIQNMIKHFPPGEAIYVHSKLDQQSRRKNINEFREGEFKYILVCDLFNEGIDIPETNILIFLRSTASRRIWLQQLGRGLRKTSNKEFVYVLDFVGSMERMNDVKELKRNIQQCPLDRDQLEIDDVPKKRGHDKIWDNSIEVKFNTQAAQVLTLLEEFEYRLTTRSRLIEALRCYIEDNSEIPTIEDVFHKLTEFTLDQISTLFGSFYGLLVATIPDINIEDTAAYKQSLDFIRRFKQEHDMCPLPETVALQFQFSGLQLFTPKEISAIFSTEIDQKYTKIEPIETDEKSIDVAPHENTKKNLLFEELKDSVRSFSDLKNLNSETRSKIRDEFLSEFSFLKQINEFRKTIEK